MDIKTTLEEVKSQVESGCRALDQKIEESLRRSHSLQGDAALMQDCASMLVASYSARGYEAQSFRFTEDGTIGVLV